MFDFSFQFTYFSLSGLINAIVSFGLAGYLLTVVRKVRIARYLVYLCLALGAWSTGYVLWQLSTTAPQALFWSRVLMAGAIFTSISLLHLVVVFLKLDTIKKYRRMLVAFYIPCFFWEIVNWTPYFVSGVEARGGFSFWPTPGPFYHPYVLLFLTHVVISAWLLYREYKQGKGDRRMQALVLLVGITVTFVGGSTNYFLWYNIPIAPWGNLGASLYAILTVYAIMKYGLLNLRVVAAEVFTVALMTIALIDVFLSEALGEFLLNVTVLFFMSLFGVMLVTSIRKEVGRTEELSKLAKSLEHANLRLQELDRQKTEFLSIASHQLRTPLSIIKGYIELLSDGVYGRVTKKMKHIFANIDESNERLVKLVDEFLDITRIEQGRTKFLFRSCDMKTLISGVVAEFKTKAKEKQLTIVWNAKHTPTVEATCDKEKIRHVLFNYFDNAIKYTDEGSIVVECTQEKKGVAVRVTDTGIGFKEGDKANFFQKFYRGKNVEGSNVNGTGLGIYVCRKFVEAHGGHVWAKSLGTGRGAEFGFWIPFEHTTKAKIP